MVAGLKEKLALWDGALTLKEAFQSFGGNTPSEIPKVVRLFENPDSPWALPGKITLHDHDCLHIILDLGLDNDDEAFVLGFTMGNDTNTAAYHVHLFKLASRCLYPATYRFTQRQFQIFKQGFEYGKMSKFKNLNRLNFQILYPERLVEIRAFLEISLDEVRQRRGIGPNFSQAVEQ
jgi:hypothetical protein